MISATKTQKHKISLKCEWNTLFKVTDGKRFSQQNLQSLTKGWGRKKWLYYGRRVWSYKTNAQPCIQTCTEMGSALGWGQDWKGCLHATMPRRPSACHNQDIPYLNILLQRRKALCWCLTISNLPRHHCNSGSNDEKIQQVNEQQHRADAKADNGANLTRF